MTRACFTWRLVPSVWFPCMFWLEFLQVFLWEILENDFGKQPLGCCWPCPWKYHKGCNLKSCCGFLVPPRTDPKSDLWEPDLSHTCGMSSGLELLCICWLLLGSSGPEQSSGCSPLSPLHVWGFPPEPWCCWSNFWGLLFYLPSSVLVFHC